MKFRNIKTGEISEPFFEGEYAYWNDICGIGSRQMLINEFNSLFEPINKLTCRGCNNELDNCTCNVLTTRKEQTEELKLIDEDERLRASLISDYHYAEIKDVIKDACQFQLDEDQLVVNNLEAENGKLRERIKEL
ncbi:MAG: hypothetical protein GX905_09355, partial [Bacteroidales bacterium]|nr:hypothetical protein [Bacteroidales bacterium]